MQEAAIGVNGEIVKRLIKAGADVNIAKRDGNTALTLIHFYDRGEYTDAQVALLESGANVNAADTSGGTALMNAASNGNVEVVKMLLERGTDMNMVNFMHKSALHLSMSHTSNQSFGLLLQAGADVTGKGRNILVESFDYEDVTYTDKLINAGAKVNVFRESGDMPLIVVSFGFRMYKDEVMA